MKTLILAAFLFAASFLSAQNGSTSWIRSTTIDTTGAGLTGGIIKLSDGEVPVACWLDTLTDLTNVRFEVILGDSSGYWNQSDQLWRWLTVVGDTTIYSLPLRDDRVAPLNSAVMNSLLAGSSRWTQQNVYIRPLLTVQQDKPTTFYMRVRYQ